MQVNIIEAIEILKSDSENLRKVMEYYGIEFKYDQAKCPFHNDSHPSLAIKGGKYKCFTKTCEAAGDLVDFIRYKESMGILEAVKKAIEILGLQYTIQKDKLDNLREYIESNFKAWYKDENYKFEDVYFYRDKNNNPVLARIKFKDPNTGKKQFSQANILEVDSFYKLEFDKTKEKHNLIYNMPRVIKSIQENKNIFMLEGEKDADNLIKLGLAATTCRDINSVDYKVLRPLHGANLVVIADNDKAGMEHVKNVRYNLLEDLKSFRVLTLKEIQDLGNKADISDFIKAKFEEGLKTRDIRKIILDKVKITLDEKNINELQQDYIGIYQTYVKEVDGEPIERKIYLTNFNVKHLTRIENIDTDEEVIELVISSNLGETKTIKGKSNKIFLDPKSFNSFMNMGFFFDGKPKDLNKLKAWVNKYFLLEKRTEYLLTGIRDIDNKKMLVTPAGSLLANGSIDTNYKADNHITLMDYAGTGRLTKDKAIELSKHLFKFNTEKNCYNIIGSLVSNMFNSVYRESKGINVHVTSLVGESGSGKSFTIDNITRPLLGLDNDTMVFSSIMPHGLLRALNDTYLATIIDEVKPSQAGEFKRQLLSNTIRSVTGESTVIKGTQNQGIKTYKYNSSLIIAGEEALDETALKNRCNIIWFSCNDLTDETLENGSYFMDKEGKEVLKSLGMEIYLYIMNNFNSEKLQSVLNKIENSFKYDTKLHPRIQATFNNSMLGYITVKHILKAIGGDSVQLADDNKVSKLIYQNLKENVLDGEYATKQVYDEILEAIDELAAGTGQYSIAEGIHYKQDNIYIKLDIKAIYPILEAYYRYRGQSIKIDCKSFTKMLTKSKYVNGTNEDYYKVVKLDGKSKRCYFIEKEKLNNLDMPILNHNLEWEDL